MTSALCIVFALLTGVGIGVFVYLKKKLKKRLHRQPQQDPHNDQYRQAEGDKAEHDSMIPLPMPQDWNVR